MLTLLAFSFIGFRKGLMMVAFVISAFLLILIVLLQEPKGGGLSAAFGGAGAETFGVQTGGVNKATSYIATAFIVIAIFYAAMREEPDDSSIRDEMGPTVGAPENAGESGDPDDSGDE